MNGGQVIGSVKDGLAFTLPLVGNKYCLAQVDDYARLPRHQFPHYPPLRLQLEARLSAPDLPGTWGFGFWNDPFSFCLDKNGLTRALPVLPNAAWFFYGSSANYLSLHEDQPSAGFHAKVFKAPRLPGLFSLLALPILPLLFVPFFTRCFRRLARLLIKEDARQIKLPLTEWHHFDVSWVEDQVSFFVDGSVILNSHLSPKGPLGCVLWMDNQYLWFDPSGKPGYGFEDIRHQQYLRIRRFSIASK